MNSSPVVSKCVKTVVCRFEFVCCVKMHHGRQPVKCKEKGRERERVRERETVEWVRITVRGRETPRRRERERTRKRDGRVARGQCALE